MNVPFSFYVLWSRFLPVGSRDFVPQELEETPPPCGDEDCCRQCEA